APASPGAASGGAGQGPSAPGGARSRTVRDIVGPVVIEPPPPRATSTVFFFDIDSDKLTDDDIKSLDAYPAAYLQAKSSTKIHVEGWACNVGNEQHNKDLSKRRANVVANHLRNKGVLIGDAQGL